MNPFQTGKELDPPQRVGAYRIEERLGSGGMGVVYRAFDEVLQRPLAIKQLLPGKVDAAASQRFRREAMAAARLNHPAIVHIYDIVETDKGDWIVMELVEGQRLDRLLRAGSVDLPQALRLSREITEGLAEAHRQGILHRDLKATNVMVTASGRAKILDFGLAKFLDLPDTHLSRTGVLIGTYHAMSPEQALGLDLDLRSDLFSLGSLLYEVFTGISPFRSSSAAETLARICSLRPTPVQLLREEIPGDVADLIDLLLRKDPNHRPQSAREVAAILEDAEASNRLAKRVEAPSGVEAPSVERVEPVTESTLIDG
ncbi:MAG TPA: serine/threonine-protein kinase, partial [Thermoanaerobaculia bacterium]|nr:serine/threonine-protein kinase [Thermoanaerobaculia bacterium]